MVYLVLKHIFNKYITAFDFGGKQGGTIVMSNVLNGWEQFKFVLQESLQAKYLPKGVIGIKSIKHNQYITFMQDMNNGIVQSYKLDGWEHINIIDNGDGSISFKSAWWHNNRYLTVIPQQTNGGITQKVFNGQRTQRFYIVPHATKDGIYGIWCPDTYKFITMMPGANQRQNNVNNNGPALGPWEEIQFVPVNNAATNIKNGNKDINIKNDDSILSEFDINNMVKLTNNFVTKKDMFIIVICILIINLLCIILGNIIYKQYINNNKEYKIVSSI